ncbi:MAG: ABC transporter substrate-binding protein [Anaerolineales bacterium]|nr:ABC transporter substrate-binding protein [Anaerolineales bacterium]
MNSKHLLSRSLALSLILLLILAAVGCTSKDDETKDKTHTPSIAILQMAPIIFDPVVDGFKTEMATLGYTEGQNINYTLVVSPDSTMGVVEEALEKNDFDVLVIIPAGVKPNSYVLGLQELGNTPIVFTPGGTDPVVEGYAESLTKPNMNVTGVLVAEADERRFQLFLEMLPNANRIAIPYDATNPTSAAALANIQALANVAGVELLLYDIPVGDAEATPNAIAQLPDDVDGIFVLKVWATVPWLEISAQRRIPNSVDSADTEGFHVLAYGPSLRKMGEQAAGLVSQILNGTPAGDLPIETSEFVLTINLGAANAIGLTIPTGLLEQAQEIRRDEVLLPAAVPTESVVGACNAQVTSPGGTNTICVTTACSGLTSSAFLSYSDQTDVEACSTEAVVGICSTSAYDIYYYDGQASSLATGCGFLSGTWQE